jgi:hypothetical protein
LGWQDFVYNKDSGVVVPPAVDAQIQCVYDALTRNSADHVINYSEFIAAVMWRRINYDEEKVGACGCSSGDPTSLA